MTNSDAIEIVCSTDDKYVMPTGVMLTSLFENNKGECVNIHLLHGGITDEHIGQLKSLVAGYGQQICFYKMDELTFKDFPIGKSYQNSHVGASMATYYRLILTQVLSDDIEKVIYIDGDILVADSLRGLWNTDISDKALAAVPDSFTNDITHYNRLRYSQKDGYFNAGLLLINLIYWREQNLVDKFLDYVKYNPERLACHDQDVLNYFLKDAKMDLPFKYNMLNEYWFDVRYNMVSWEYEEQIREGQRHPVIVHFTCIPKPWYKNCKHPYKREFDKYRAMTVWGNVRERRWLPVKYLMEQLCIKLVVLIGLRKPDYIAENRYINI